MRSHVRTILVLAVALALVVAFLYNVDLRGVATSIAGARPGWLVLSLVTTFANLAIRALRWQYLLAPLGPTRFVNAFRATAVGFAANAVLPARAGEVIRPYFLARQAPPEQHGRMTAIGAFATIILERLLDRVRTREMGRRQRRARRDLRARRLVRPGGRSRASGPRDGAAGAGAAVEAGGDGGRHRGEIRARPRRDSPSGTADRGARVVVPALAVDLRRHLVDDGGVPVCDPLHRIVPVARAPGAGGGGADAGRGGRLSRGVSRRRHGVLRRAGCGGGGCGDRAARVLDRSVPAARAVVRRAGRAQLRQHAAARQP